MFNTITMKNNSSKFNSKETSIIIKLLDYARIHFINGTGSYLAQLNLEKIKFNWCNNMNKFLNDDMIYGAWTPFYFNEIFLSPSFYSNNFINFLKEDKNYKKIINYIDKEWKKEIYDNLSIDNRC